ncbi:MAG: hypothetical protein H0U74_14885 [Bradymonadaceae bacterium]|nr:hypothetical protein [Lujinxingiaceae bacterium]
MAHRIAFLLLFVVGCAACESKQAAGALAGQDASDVSSADIVADLGGDAAALLDTATPADAIDADAGADTQSASDAELVDLGSWRSELYGEHWSPDWSGPEGRFLHDFSYAGYENGASPLGVHRAEAVFDVTDFAASPGGVLDATEAIQAAIDAATSAGGGTVYFAPGLYRVDGRLFVRASNIILKGDGPEASRIHFTRVNAMSHTAHLTIGAAREMGASFVLAGDAISRTSFVEVADVSGLAVGDDVALGWQISDAFIEEHRMEGTWGAFNGTWQPFFRRTVVAIDDTSSPARVHLDVPLRYDARVRDQASLRIELGLIEQCGVEGLGFANATGWEEAWSQNQVHALFMDGVKDCWIQNVASFASPSAPEHGPGAGAHLQSGGILLRHAKRVTVADSSMALPQHRGVGGNGYLFEVRQSNEVLFRDLVARAGRHNFIQNWGFGTSGVVWLRAHSLQGRALPSRDATISLVGHSEFHHSLAMANLIDSCLVEDGWSAVNRHKESSGAGHTATESVFWNTRGAGIVRSFQAGHGYVIGTAPETIVRTELPEISAEQRELLEPISPWGYSLPGDWTEGLGRGDALVPASLYEDQLRRRLP